MKQIHRIISFILILVMMGFQSQGQISKSNHKSSSEYRSDYQRTEDENFHTLEIRNGKLWSRGRNNFGQLGNSKILQ